VALEADRVLEGGVERGAELHGGEQAADRRRAVALDEEGEGPVRGAVHRLGLVLVERRRVGDGVLVRRADPVREPRLAHPAVSLLGGPARHALAKPDGDLEVFLPPVRRVRGELVHQAVRQLVGQELGEVVGAALEQTKAPRRLEEDLVVAGPGAQPWVVVAVHCDLEVGVCRVHADGHRRRERTPRVDARDGRRERLLEVSDGPGVGGRVLDDEVDAVGAVRRPVREPLDAGTAGAGQPEAAGEREHG